MRGSRYPKLGSANEVARGQLTNADAHQVDAAHGGKVGHPTVVPPI
jgi:hypothetical protein